MRLQARNSKIARKSPEARREAWNVFLLIASEGADPADTLILNF